MFVCCSEISISVTVKHMKHNEIIGPFCLPRGDFLSFLSGWGTENITGLWFAREGRSVPRATL